ncbi:hypothetical protein [Shigella dysenteriae]|nr:hypothetical protein [Shigella dysenteriae]WNT52320.1 hypothetical protein PWP84_09535 [Shigella dysenteriae]
MNVNAGHERTSKARIIHQIQLIRGITTPRKMLFRAHLILSLTLHQVIFEILHKR